MRRNPPGDRREFLNSMGQNNETERHDLLFAFIQYIERQVVLFDAIEDAAFAEVNNMLAVEHFGILKKKQMAVGS